jgi:acyl-CoA reductase-like NAD-dependent aldehyde dehydrogenase
MTKMIQCISPVDGRVYAERPALSPEAASAAVARAKAAQGAWAARPLDDRIARVTAGIAALGDEKAAIVEELAWQMGRPVRFGGEFGGVNERTAYMAGIAEEALAPMVAESSDRFDRRIERAPQGVVFVIAPWN